jgi:hypothetical protein
MKITVRNAYEYLKKNGFKYKGHNVTERTVRTMSQNGTFKTLTKCECGRCFFVEMKEIEMMVKDNG